MALGGQVGGVQYDVTIAGHPVGAGEANPLLRQPPGLRQFEMCPWQQVDDEGTSEAFGQCLIERSLKQQQGIAILTEQVEQHEVIGVVVGQQEGEGIGVVQVQRPVNGVRRVAEEGLKQGQYLFIQIDAVVPSLWPARPQMTSEIATAQSQFQYPACVGGQQVCDALLMGQAEGGRFGKGHGRLHYTVYLQPAVMVIFQDGEASFRFGTQVQ